MLIKTKKNKDGVSVVKSIWQVKQNFFSVSKFISDKSQINFLIF